MRTIAELVEAVREEAERAEFPVDEAVYKKAGKDPMEPILFAGSRSRSRCAGRQRRPSLIEQRQNYLWQLHDRPWQGRGRTDTFNTTKLAVLKFPDDGTIGTTDLPQTWNQAVRRDMWLHWDANNNKIEQRNYAAAMAVGATPFSVIPTAFQRTNERSRCSSS